MFITDISQDFHPGRVFNPQAFCTDKAHYSGSGEKVYLTLRPAQPNTGVVFRRVDLTDPVADTTDGGTLELVRDLGASHQSLRSAVVALRDLRGADQHIQRFSELEIEFADYDIEQPRAAIVLSVDDVGEMEFQLFLTRP